MKWTSAQATTWETAEALGALCDQVADAIAAPDLIVVFCARGHQTRFAQVPSMVRARFPDATLIGCSARGVIGGGEEVEEEPSISIVAAALPGVELAAFRVPDEVRRTSDEGWAEMIGTEPRAALVLTDTYSCDSDGLLSALNARFPGMPVIGGLASSATHPGGNGLFLDDAFFSDGGVGVSFSGPLQVETIVAQGCRPAGPSETVARAQGNVLVELESGRPDKWVDRLHAGLTDDQRHLIPGSLFVGVRRGDEWLIRTIMGFEPNSGAMTLTERLEPGDEVRFFLRDASTSTDDLADAVQAYAAFMERPPAGGFLFSCIGRGQRLYGESGHDSQMLFDAIGAVPLGGFFCAGEFGPVAGRNYVHGYTSTFALFRALDPS